MAKVGTPHIEIKPVLNEEALAALGQRIEDAVAEAIARGIARSQPVKIASWDTGVHTSMSGTLTYTPDGE